MTKMIFARSFFNRKVSVAAVLLAAAATNVAARPINSAADQVIDQLAQVIEDIRRTPDSRRLIVSAWNPAVLPDDRVSPQDNVRAGRAALASCHALFQFYVAGGRLSCQLYQRSTDCPVGLVFNIAQYALLTCMVAQQCDLAPGDFVWTGGDCHIYQNQF